MKTLNYSKGLLFIGFCLLGLLASGEITLNDKRLFTTNNNTLFKVDDTLVTASVFQQSAVGMAAKILIDEDVNSDVTSGTALEINAENQIIGPITNLEAFKVFGQDVVIDADTIFMNTSGVFELGQLLKISGNYTLDNILLASRIELVSVLDEYKLIAHLSNINGNIASFGDLQLDLSGVTLINCGSGAIPGTLIEIKADFVTDFDIALSLNSITSFECKSGFVILPTTNDSTTLQYSAEGFITQIVDSTHFNLNGQQAEYSMATEFINGTSEDLTTGVKVEAEGVFDVISNQLSVDKLTFNNVRVRIIAPVKINELDNSQVDILDIIGVFTALTKDGDSLIPLLPSDSQLEIRGYLDSGNNLLVDEIKERGLPDSNDVRLRGPVSSFINEDFQILGVNIDTTAANFFIDNISVDRTTFFASLANEAEVDIDKATYDETSNTLLGGDISLEETSSMTIQNAGATDNQTKTTFERAQANGLGAIGKGRISKFSQSTGALPSAIVAATEISINEGLTVTLDGSNSTGEQLSYSWFQTSGPDVSLSDVTSAITTFIAPQVNSTSNISFELTVTDNIGNTDTNTVSISVNNIVITQQPPSSGGGGSLGFGILGLLFIVLPVVKNTNI